ncbi:hypothetical protein RFI_09330, partial [Reticulomyxa filosa]
GKKKKKKKKKVYGLYDALNQVGEHKTLYYSPYPSLMSYMIKFWFDFLTLSGFLIYNWTNQPCCDPTRPLDDTSVWGLFCCCSCSIAIGSGISKSISGKLQPQLNAHDPAGNAPQGTVPVQNGRESQPNPVRGFYHEHDETKVFVNFYLCFPKMKSAEIGVEETKYDLLSVYRDRRGSITRTPSNARKVFAETINQKSKIVVITFFWENVFEKRVAEKEWVNTFQFFMNSFQEKDVIIYFLTNLQTLELFEQIKSLECESHVTYNCQRIVAERRFRPTKSTESDTAELDDLEIDMELRIQGRDSPIRQKNGMSLQTILLKIMQVTQCPHENFLYVDCHKAILSHLVQIQLCRTYQVSKKGLIDLKEFKELLAMT